MHERLGWSLIKFSFLYKYGYHSRMIILKQKMNKCFFCQNTRNFTDSYW
jgi:hypothetical protein